MYFLDLSSVVNEVTRILQIETVFDLKQKIYTLEQGQKEKDGIINDLKADKNLLEEKLKGRTTLISYLLNLLRKSQNVIFEGKKLIENHSSDVDTIHSKMDE